MPQRVGGQEPDPDKDPTEYGGDLTLPNTVQGLGPELGRKLENHEKLRLGYLTGQEEDPDAPRELGFMGGVDSNYPEHPDLSDFIPPDFRSEDYLE
jgi:hypothetical protein